MDIPEVHIITTEDGLSLEIPTELQVFLSTGGYGMPPIDYLTRSGYLQDGATELGYRLDTRPVTVEYYASGQGTREEYWEARAALLEIVRPNRGGQLTFGIQLADGTYRYLKARANPGFQYPPVPPTENAWNIRETLEFIAFDPVWFGDPETVILGGTLGEELVFPIDFPIYFGVGGLDALEVITYVGSWKSFPTFTINGPYDRAYLIHEELNAIVGLFIPILAGESRVIDLSPGIQSVLDGSGGNRMSELDPNSDLTNFCLRPDPEVAGGINTIRVLLYNSSTSSVTMTYYSRYIGI